MTREITVAGNWKMHGGHAETENLIRGILKDYDHQDSITAVICPPFISLSLAAWLLEDSKIKLGAQDLSENNNGAFTGDISAEMLKEAGVKYAIIGHSERRQFHYESDELISAKVRRALDSGLRPIICIGETLDQREAGETEQVISQQFDRVVSNLSGNEIQSIIIAYEPVWAIGTGETASPEMAQEVHGQIRKLLENREPDSKGVVPIIYGGSVKPDNAEGLFGQPDIDGALVGGASLEAGSFLSILAAAKVKEI